MSIGRYIGTVAKIYRDAEVAHGITWPIMVILAKDETKVKAQLAWEAKGDVLTRFCGLKELWKSIGLEMRLHKHIHIYKGI